MAHFEVMDYQDLVNTYKMVVTVTGNNVGARADCTSELDEGKAEIGRKSAM